MRVPDRRERAYGKSRQAACRRAAELRRPAGLGGPAALRAAAALCPAGPIRRTAVPWRAAALRRAGARAAIRRGRAVFRRAAPAGQLRTSSGPARPAGSARGCAAAADPARAPGGRCSGGPAGDRRPDRHRNGGGRPGAGVESWPGRCWLSRHAPDGGPARRDVVDHRIAGGAVGRPAAGHSRDHDRQLDDQHGRAGRGVALGAELTRLPGCAPARAQELRSWPARRAGPVADRAGFRSGRVGTDLPQPDISHDVGGRITYAGTAEGTTRRRVHPIARGRGGLGERLPAAFADGRTEPGRFLSTTTTSSSYTGVVFL
jgi:hypothetical protein